MGASIPSEISDYIIDFLHNDRPTLSLCSVVCKEWLPASRHHLFSSLHIGDKSGPLLCDALTSYSETTIPRRCHNMHFQFLSADEEDKQEAIRVIQTLSRHFQRVTGRLSIFSYSIPLPEFLSAAFSSEESSSCSGGGLRDFASLWVINVRLNHYADLDILASKSQFLRSILLQDVDIGRGAGGKDSAMRDVLGIGSAPMSVVPASLPVHVNLGHLRSLDLGDIWSTGLLEWLKSHKEAFESIEELDVMYLSERDSGVGELLASCGSSLKRLKVSISADIHCKFLRSVERKEHQ